MALTWRSFPGSQLGPYTIIGIIGAGGMGEVYRARDTNLGRDVAIKVLPDAVAADAERLMRFEREARTLASLNHPNIAHVYGVEKSGLAYALVIELVDGPTLSELIATGTRGLAIADALAIARHGAVSRSRQVDRQPRSGDNRAANSSGGPCGRCA